MRWSCVSGWLLVFTGVALGAPVLEPEGLVWRDPTVVFFKDPPLPAGAVGRLGQRIASAGVVAFSADGALLATAHGEPYRPADSQIHLWDAGTGKHLHALDISNHTLLSVVFSPNGKLLAAGGMDNCLRVWDTKTGKQVGETQQHEGHVYAICFTPDSKQLVTTSSHVRLWDAERVVELYKFRPSPDRLEFLLQAALSPDGKTLATGGEEGLRLWKLPEGKLLHTIPGWVTTYPEKLTFSQDGKFILVANRGGRVLERWDAATGKSLEVPPRPKGSAFVTCFSANGATMVVPRSQAGVASSLVVADVATGQERSRILCPDASVWCRLDAEGETVATGSVNGAIRVWDGKTGSILRTLLGPSHAVMSFRFAGDGAGVTSLTRDSSLHEWDSAQRRERRRTAFPLPDNQDPLRLSPDGSLLLATDPKAILHVWDARTGRERWKAEVPLWVVPGSDSPKREPLASIPSSLPDVLVATSHDGRRVAGAVDDGSYVAVWAGEGTRLAKASLSGPVQALALSPTGTTLYLSAGSTPDGNVVGILDAATAKETRKLTLPAPAVVGNSLSARVVALVPSPNEKRLAVVEKIEYETRAPRERVPTRHTIWSVYLWDIDGKSEPVSIPPAAGRLVAFSSDGKYLACLAAQHGVAVWDIAAKTLRQSGAGHEAAVTALAFSPDGKTLASASEDATILLWDPAKLPAVAKMP